MIKRRRREIRNRRTIRRRKRRGIEVVGEIRRGRSWVKRRRRQKGMWRETGMRRAMG